MKHFTLNLDVSECDFNVYDVTRDNGITKKELVAVIGDNRETTDVFQALDMFSGALLCFRILHHTLY